MAFTLENCAVKIAGSLAKEAKLGRYQEELIAYALKILLATIVSYLTIFTVSYFSLIATLILVMVTALLTFYCIWIWAPADTPQKPIEDEVHRIKLRIASFFLTMFWFLFFTIFTFLYISHWITIASAYALLWHAFMITPAGYATADFLDRIAKKFRI